MFDLRLVMVFPLLTYTIHMQAVLCAGLYPNVASIDASSHSVWYDGKREVRIHPSSINSSQKTFQYPFLVFLEKVRALSCKLS